MCTILHLSYEGMNQLDHSGLSLILSGSQLLSNSETTIVLSFFTTNQVHLPSNSTYMEFYNMFFSVSHFHTSCAALFGIIHLLKAPVF